MSQDNATDSSQQDTPTSTSTQNSSSSTLTQQYATVTSFSIAVVDANTTIVGHTATAHSIVIAMAMSSVLPNSILNWVSVGSWYLAAAAVLVWMLGP